VYKYWSLACSPKTVKKCDTSQSNHQWRKKATGLLVENDKCFTLSAVLVTGSSHRNSMKFIRLGSCTKHRSWPICHIHQSWERGMREMGCYRAYWNINGYILWTKQYNLCFHKPGISWPAKQISTCPKQCTVAEPHTCTHISLPSTIRYTWPPSCF